jgi:hypothetical protein
MGKANRERRRMKEKARKKARQRDGQGPGSFFVGFDAPGTEAFGRAVPPASQWDRAITLLAEAVIAAEKGDGAAVARAVARLADPDTSGWRRTVERVLLHCLTLDVKHLWECGWQPADVLRVVERRLKTQHHHLLRSAMAAELAGYAAVTIDERWHDQLAEADVTVWWPADETMIAACGRLHPGGWADFIRLAVELMDLIERLPSLPVLGHLPGTAQRATSRPRAAVDERVLARVRALLAKAESTPYPAEAETFTAGAQALMARHSIDHALLSATGQSPPDEPTGRRIGIDNPYEAPKTTLLDAVASANRCRTVWSRELGFVTVIGFPSDLDTVEVMFTSLLVQATSALTREGPRTDGAGRNRTRAFRQSFLLSYAQRIRERLTRTTREQTEAAAAEAGDDRLLPVLASRDADVDEATKGMFPSMTFTRATAARDGEGWAVGRAAADLATLSQGPELE